jgi:hypothetical protein
VLIEFIAFELVGCAGAIGRRFAEARYNRDGGCSLKVAPGDYGYYVDGRARSTTCIHHIHFGCGTCLRVFGRQGLGSSGFAFFFNPCCCCA